MELNIKQLAVTSNQARDGSTKSTINTLPSTNQTRRDAPTGRLYGSLLPSSNHLTFLHSHRKFKTGSVRNHKPLAKPVGRRKTGINFFSWCSADTFRFLLDDIGDFLTN